MAGGKETPRQKMIGMMYLVLTAMLALNVSKDVLRAFVAIEDNMQKANAVQLDKGNSFLYSLQQELSTLNSSEKQEIKKRFEIGLSILNQIDQEAGSFIEFLDELKFELLRKNGEDVSKVKDGATDVIIWAKGKGVTPSLLNLGAVQGQDQYDEVMNVMGIADDLKQPKGKGLELWNRLLAFRKKMVELTGTYEWGDKKYSVTVDAINDFKSQEDLNQQLLSMFDRMKDFNRRDDLFSLKDIYATLTKNERLDVRDAKGLHWVGATFDHAPLVAAIASLTALQNDVLSARSVAFGNWASKLGSDEYGFDSIIPLIYGQAIANTGDSVYLTAMMAAFNSGEEPKLSLTQQGSYSISYPGNGLARLGFKVGSGSELNLDGELSIRNKSGVVKSMPWNYNLKIMQPQGTISLPKMNILYRGLENEVEAVASGYDKTIVTGSGVQLTKKGNSWIAIPENVKTATITIYGENSVSGKRIQLSTQQFVIKQVPEPIIYMGAAKSGSLMSLADTKIFAKVPPEFPLNVTYDVVDWELSVAGMASPPVRGVGSQLSPEAVTLLRSVKKGMSVIVRTSVRNPSKILVKSTGVFTI